ncbi:MAG: hypothetical protein JO102_03970 [Elusimicrobia bacterium]|nr:hypothetical protein [Elusimicrobiota bacterium]
MKSWLLIMCVLFAAPARLAADPLPATPAEPPGFFFNFQNADIDAVLKFVGDMTGQIFIKSDAVRGNVTVMAPGRVSKEEALQILQSVLEVRGFTLVPGPGRLMRVLAQAEATQTGLRVADGDSDTGDGMLTQVLPVKFLSVQDMRADLSGLVSRGGSLIADPRSNAFVVTDVASNIRRLAKVIASLDVRSPQVLIEALMVEVSLTRETKLGFEWSRSAGFTADGRRFNDSATQTFDLPSFITEGLRYSVLRADGQLSAVLQALSTDQNVNILSTPHVLAVNNQTAVIRVGEEVPVLTQTRNVQGGETIRSFDYKQVAIELEVTPRINPDRDVFLKVHPIVKKILGFNAELNAPILATREAQTAVQVKDGETVVIGGLMKDDRSSARSKVPILGDIPLLGALFRKSDATREKTELLVFITPRVIFSSADAQAVTVSKESESRSPVTPNRKRALELYKTGRKLAAKKKRAEAAAAFEEAIRLSPDDRLKRKAEAQLRKNR